MNGIVINGMPNVQRTLEETNSQVLSEQPNGRWEYVNVGGGKHVDSSTLDPFAPYTYLIQHPSVNGRFAVFADQKVNRGLARAWSRIPQSIKTELGSKFAGGQPTDNTVFDNELGSEWFPQTDV